MTRARRKSKLYSIDVYLFRILSDLSLRATARQSAALKLRDRAHDRFLSLGEYRQLLERLP